MATAAPKVVRMARASVSEQSIIKMCALNPSSSRSQASQSAIGTLDNLSRYVLLGPLQTHWDSPVVSMKATGVPLPVLRFFTTRVYRNAEFDLIVQ